MQTHVLTQVNTRELLEGLAVLGTGGGGSPSFGRSIIENDYRHGRKYTMIEVEDIPDDAFIVSCAIMGSVKAIDTACVERIVESWEDRFDLLIALRTIEELFGKEVDYLIPFELGGLNTPVVLSLGARVGIPVVNGDALGRAAPETQMTSFLGHGISLTPMSIIDDKGNVIIVKETEDLMFPDRIGRWMVTNADGMGANTHYPMSGKALKSSVVPKTITKAIKVGKVILEANDEDRSVVKKVASLVRGHVFLERGVVEEIREEDRGGFLNQVVLLQGTDKQGSKQVKLVIKNEVMLCQLEGRNVCIFPDLTLILDPDTGRGIMSSERKVGQEISIILAPCHPRLREALKNPQGKLAFSPARFGYEDLEYSPLETLSPTLEGI